MTRLRQSHYVDRGQINAMLATGTIRVVRNETPNDMIVEETMVVGERLTRT